MAGQEKHEAPPYKCVQDERSVRGTQQAVGRASSRESGEDREGPHWHWGQSPGTSGCTGGGAESSAT